MMRIFEPIFHNALVYIDDILLFSETKNEYRLLLQEILELAKKYGVMMSEKNSTVGSSDIEFLRMMIANKT